MTFVYIVKTVLTKWINTLSKRGFSTALVRQETQMSVHLASKNNTNEQRTCCSK